MNIKIGAKIKELRKRDDVTQERLAEVLGVTNQAISRWESETGYPDIEYILPIARFFNITADFLLDNDIIQKNDECEKSDENPGVEIKFIVPTGNDLNDDFETIREIADYLLDKKTTVILNLENVSQEMETRYLDFLKGIAYSIEGQIRKAADNKYFLAPKHIDIQQDRRQQIKIP